MNYIGSKNRLSEFIISTIKDSVGELHNKTFAELFAGTGVISRSLKNQVKRIIVNDLEYYSYTLMKHYIGNNTPFDYGSLFEFLEKNDVTNNKHFIFNEYSENGSAERLYFSAYNGQQIDRIRQNLQALYQKNDISESVFYFALASLLESADKYANTASVYGAYLKHLKKSAQEQMTLEAATFDVGTTDVEVYNQDSNTLIKHISGDILYLDPPYNARQYGANYHLLNTIAKYDDFTPKGKTGLREYAKSAYCSKHTVSTAFEELIREAKFKHIFVSYNNEGLMSPTEIEQICSRYGRYSVVTRECRRYKADKDQHRQYASDETVEYLHILEKNK